MASELSPQSEGFIRDALAGGMFRSRESVLDAAIDALREKQATTPLIPAEHMALVEAAIEDLEKNGGVEITDAYWDELKDRVRRRAEAKRIHPSDE